MTNIMFTSSNIILMSPVNVPSNQFTGFESGLYWFHISAGVPENTAADLRLNGLAFPVALSATNVTTFPQNCITIDSLQTVLPLMELTISTNYTVFSSQNFETSFFGFRLNSILSPMKAFSIRADLIYPSTLFKTVNFGEIIENEGHLFVKNSKYFMTKERGTYIYSINLDMSSTRLRLTINNETIKTLCACINAYGFIVSSSRAIGMVTLNENDVIQLETKQDLISIHSSAMKVTIIFTCFLYSPVSNIYVAWSVVAGIKGIYSGPLDCQSFDIIFINLQNPWKADTSRAVIPVAGIYFVDLTAYLCGAFLPKEGDGNPEKQILLNGRPIVIVRFRNATFSGCLTRSRTTIVKLDLRDELRVKILTTGFHYYSDMEHQESFTGFLLQRST